MRLALIYHYFELNEDYKDNLIYFLSKNLDRGSDIFLVISGHCTVNIQQHENIHVLYVENKNNDYGGYAALLSSPLSPLNFYDAFIFINSSVRGPFLPSYLEIDWKSLFTNKLNLGFDLVGITNNQLEKNSRYSKPYRPGCNSFTDLYHIQTTVYALSKKGLEHLFNCGFYDNKSYLNKNEVILHYEIGLTQQLKSGGFKVCNLLGWPDKYDYPLHCNFSSASGDILNVNSFYCRTLSPFELMFIKVNRKLISQADLASITYTSLVSDTFLTKDWKEVTGLIQRSRQKIIKFYRLHKRHKNFNLLYKKFKIITLRVLNKIR